MTVLLYAKKENYSRKILSLRGEKMKFIKKQIWKIKRLLINKKYEDLNDLRIKIIIQENGGFYNEWSN